jgi:hypothetical protein
MTFLAAFQGVHEEEPRRVALSFVDIRVEISRGGTEDYFEAPLGLEHAEGLVSPPGKTTGVKHFELTLKRLRGAIEALDVVTKHRVYHRPSDRRMPGRNVRR